MTLHCIRLYVLFVCVTCVSAEDWDDFANNLATDLAPLIALFGEQITRQCLSELITTLDDFIFALAPLGILTAVVSAIRVRGNSTLRAFIGRAQEDPGAVERELLSCVSDSTAEIFSNSGVARITGNPIILEVLVNDTPRNNEKITIEKISDGVGKLWPSDLEDDIQMPNLSLNKGIKRRAPIWFHLAAAFGVALQGGVIVFAGLTVFYWPDAFQKNGHNVDSYAFPMFVVGTMVLTLGMFLCAVAIERSSKKHLIPLPDDSRVYWVQPGNQMVGDQVFPPFVGCTKKGVRFVRSVRHQSPTEVLSYGEASLLLAVTLSMLGFVLQFIGQRGLHSSITLAQLGSTMVMTFVRTSLRAQRMHEGDNMLREDENLVSKGGHELDWLTFSLLKIKSFKVCPIVSSETQGPPVQSQHAHECVEKRRKLRDFTSANWNETPTRKMAIKLAQATHDLFHLVNAWTDGRCSEIDIYIPIEAEIGDLSQISQNDWKVTLSIGDKPGYHTSSWEAILGLYLWSLRRRNHKLGDVHQARFFRIFRIKDRNDHQASLLLQKWSKNPQVISQSNQIVHFLRGSQTFGHSETQEGPQVAENHGVPVAVSSGLPMLAAQDIYSHALSSLFKSFTTIGGDTRILGNDRTNFRLHNDRVDKLTAAFQNAGLGSDNEGLLSILPVLYNRDLLPEISIDSLQVRQKIESFVQVRNYYGIYSISEWLCCLDDYDNVKQSLVQYGFLCLRGLLDLQMRVQAVERIVAIASSTHDGQSISCNAMFLSHIASTPSLEWWKGFQKELYCMATCIIKYQVEYNGEQRTMQALHNMKGVSSTSETYDSFLEAVECQRTLFDLWFGSAGWVKPNNGCAYQRSLDWLIEHDHKNILEWLIMRLIDDLSPRFNEEKIGEMMVYATRKGYGEVVRMLVRHSEQGHLRFHIISGLASNGDLQTLELFFSYWTNHDTLMAAREVAFFKAAENKQHQILEINIEKGVDVNASDVNQETALMKAAAEGDADGINLLLARGAALEKRNYNQDTALIIAAEAGSMRAVQLLVEAGANINSTGDGGTTALIAAIRARSLPIVEYLLSRKADVHIQDHHRFTALDTAKQVGGYGPWTQACDLLIGAGAVHNSGEMDIND